jgi:hypothetical protein
MKRISLLLIAIINSSVLFAQSDTTAKGNNELKINIVSLVLGAPEVFYERSMNQSSSFGLAVLMGIDDMTDYRFAAIPYYRLYFGQKEATGFFIEANTGLITANQDRYHYNSLGHTTLISKHWTTVGFGVAAGVKLFSRYGMFLDAYYGVGKLIGGSRVLSRNYPRRGITIGKRF